MKSILILSGGGIKGITHLGVLKALEELDMLKDITTIAAASVGAIVGGLFVVGYTPDEMWEFTKCFDFGKLKDISFSNILDTFGIDSGSNVEYLLKRMIKSKKHDTHITLKELYDKTKKKIIFTTVCVNKQKACYLSHENYPDLPLYLAIRMSSSIPMFYKPVLYNDLYYIDGGFIDNYPIKLFDDQLDKVIGIHICDTVDHIDVINDFETYFFLVLSSLRQGVAKCSTRGFEKHTLNIDIDSISATEFDLSIENKEIIYKKGYDALYKKFKK